jgi:hypothetical protein
MAKKIKITHEMIEKAHNAAEGVMRVARGGLIDGVVGPSIEPVRQDGVLLKLKMSRVEKISDIDLKNLDEEALKEVIADRLSRRLRQCADEVDSLFRKKRPKRRVIPEVTPTPPTRRGFGYEPIPIEPTAYVGTTTDATTAGDPVYFTGQELRIDAPMGITNVAAEPHLQP